MQETQVQSLSREDSPGGGNGNPLQDSCLENPMHRRHGIPRDPKESDTTEGLHLHFLGVYNFEEMQLMVITINREAESSFTLLTSFIFVSFSKILFFYLNELN